MNRKQFCILISLINVCLGSSVHYLGNNKALSDGSGGYKLSKYYHCFIIWRLAGCTINVNGDLADPQPLIIKPGTAAFLYPEDRTGIIYLDDEQEVEIYCTSGFRVPEGVGNSAIAKCVDGNLFEVNGTPYTFIEFTCNSIPFHTTRKTGQKCYNDAIKVDIGFDLGDRFAKVLEVCHDEETEVTYYAKYQLTPASEGRKIPH